MWYWAQCGCSVNLYTSMSEVISNSFYMIAVYPFGKTELSVSPMLSEEEKKILLRGRRPTTDLHLIPQLL